MSNPNEPAAVAHALYQATVKELSATHDPNLQREVLKQFDEMLRSASDFGTISALLRSKPQFALLTDDGHAAPMKRPASDRIAIDAAFEAARRREQALQVANKAQA